MTAECSLIHKPFVSEEISTGGGPKISSSCKFRMFLEYLRQWILLLNELICNKHDLEDCNRKISGVGWTNQSNKKWSPSGKHSTLGTILASDFVDTVCRMMSSDIMTLIQHWIEELSEMTGEEGPFSFRILVWELNYRGVMDQEVRRVLKMFAAPFSVFWFFLNGEGAANFFWIFFFFFCSGKSDLRPNFTDFTPENLFRSSQVPGVTREGGGKV